MNLDPRADLDDPRQRSKAEKEALDALRDALKNVDTRDGFSAAAQRLSSGQGAPAAVVESYEIADTAAQGRFAQALRATAPGKASEPFVENDLAQAIWVESAIQSPPMTYEEALPLLRQKKEGEILSEVKKEMESDALKRIGFDAL
ncbi:MAG: hypothetical protein BWZ10_02954 [candidate division BRC1 bacterium ADurb.BinA364]|nr:MAG: hypothetical protein BWZ10_02954 [candidate division BRC1 bacterium ADurb.BinA364]